jgi:ADP-heptose:LPS heptosyltransferase
MPEPPPYRRIVIIRIGKIGDLIVANFAIRKIRRTYPGAAMMLVTLARNRELLRYTEDVDKVLFLRGGYQLPAVIMRMRFFRPDLVLDFNDVPSTTSVLLARTSGAARRVGFSFGAPAGHLTDAVPCPSRESTHVTERLRKIPEAVGITFDREEVVPSMTLGERERRTAERHLEREGGGRIVAVNVSAGHPGRYWPAERWVQLLDGIFSERNDLRVLLLNALRDEKLAAGIAAALPASRVLRPEAHEFHSFAAYISLSHMLITPDTSAVHIAAAFQVPVVGLYPAVPWNLASWHPVGTDAEVVTPPSGLVADIQVEAVLEACRRLLGRTSS